MGLKVSAALLHILMALGHKVPMTNDWDRLLPLNSLGDWSCL